ncbi:MAG: hypothetical protein MK289_23185, partial [Trichodesmium sp. ALOHA_ZT_67]|nr:hypothetical protein [Trichodesmium sp. ALOHA_ZT_67]
MFEKFIAFIKTKEWQLDSMQIAEVLWFVHQVSEQKQEENNSQNLVSSNTEELAENFDQSYDFQLSKTASIQQPKKTPTRSSSSQYPLTTSSSNKSQNTEIQPTSLTTEKLPIKLPDIAILRNTLELSRLIKPFKQKVNSRVAQELDVNETAKISAELSTLNFPRYFPVLTPKKERWLDVVLLIEDSDSMILWQSLLPEVRDFLEHLGAFRDIKLYRIKWDNNSENLQIYPFHSPSLTLSPQELNSSDHRRLILMLSDCISLAWINQKFINILQKWATKEKLTLLNPFPERMWENTNLCYAIRLRLGNNKKQNLTQKWEAIPVEYWQEKYLNQQTVKLPILNLEPKSMAAWVNVMVGKGISWCAGAGLGLELMGPEPEEEEEPLTPREQINNFYATFSKEAWQLIQWLSAIPINLSTIRLIQRALLPNSTQINVAEVLMGGLLSPVKTFNSYRFPHQIEFEFQPGIREIFLDRLGGEEFCIGVIGRLTEKIASHFGYETIREFEAILLNEPWNFRDDQDIRLIQTFATISISTIRQYGDKYIDYIPKLDRSRAQLYLMSEVPGESINWRDFLEKVAQKYRLSSSQKEILINLFSSSQEAISISQAAQKLSLSTSAIRGRLTNIFRKFENKNPGLFESRKGSKLEALQSFLFSQYVNSYIPQILENDQIEENLQDLNSEVPGESVKWRDFLEKVAQKYRLSSSQKEILINLFPSSQEFLSISELAQKLLSSASVIKGRLNHIFPKFESKNPDLFASQKYSRLEALHLFLSSEYKNSYIPQILENDQIEENLQDLNSEVPGESVKWRDFLEKVAQKYRLSSSQKEILINLFPSSQEFLSISQAAQKLSLSTSAIRGRLTNIFRKFENKNPGLFESRKGSKLEALQSFLFSQYVN